MPVYIHSIVYYLFHYCPNNKGLGSENKNIENQRNFFQYDDETIFLKEKRVNGYRYIMFFSPRLRKRRIESFYYDLSEMEKNLDVLKRKKFHSQSDMAKTVEEELKGFSNLVDVKYDLNEMTFSYEIRHKAIQRKTNRFRYTVLITNTSIAAKELLRIYREKDVVYKMFSHIKPHPEPFFSRSENGTRAKLFLTVPGTPLLR
ncbi:MAG: hypothetical protein ACP5UZ_07840 [Thermoplasmata archaeon]